MGQRRGVPTHVDSSEDEAPFVQVLCVSPNFLTALEQDLCEENDTSQSQQVTAARADPRRFWAVVGMAVVDTLSPRGPSFQAAPSQREDSPEQVAGCRWCHAEGCE